MKIAGFIKNWILPLSMLSGVASYFVAANLPFMAAHKESVVKAVNLVQPVLIFSMLFLSFCKVDPHCMRPRKWHIWLLLIQIGTFSLLSVIASLMSATANYRVLFEAAMICMICPTATASAVITKKLGGSAEDVTTYTILINLFTAIVVPLFVPMVHPQAGQSFLMSVALIVGKVFPLLLLPFVCALLVRYLLPSLHHWLSNYFNLSFYIWAVALALAISVTTRTIIHAEMPIVYQIGVALISLVCCALQFYFGKKIGRKYNDSITAGQALGQKNTVFAIWMGFTFFTPITSIVGGFYSVWHNLVNSYQLYEKRKKDGN